MNFFTLHYWFNMRPNNFLPIANKSIIGFLVFLVILFFIFSLLKSRKNNIYVKIWQKLYNFCLTNFFIGIILLFFCYELVPFLSSRFWFLIWGVGMIFWLYIIYKNLKEIPKLKEKRAKEQEYKKYIP